MAKKLLNLNPKILKLKQNKYKYNKEVYQLVLIFQVVTSKTVNFMEMFMILVLIIVTLQMMKY